MAIKLCQLRELNKHLSRETFLSLHMYVKKTLKIMLTQILYNWKNWEFLQNLTTSVKKKKAKCCIFCDF